MSKIVTALELEARTVLDFRRMAKRQNTTPEALMIELLDSAAAAADDYTAFEFDTLFGDVDYGLI